MNIELIKLNKDLGVVTDEKGHIKVVNIEADNNNLEDILLKENEIENNEKKLVSLQNKLLEKKLFKISSIVFLSMFCFLALPLSISLAIENTDGILALVIKLIPLYVPTLLPAIWLGNPIKLHKEVVKIKEEISKSEQEIEVFKEELTRAKERSKFSEKRKVEDLSTKETITRELENVPTLSNGERNSGDIKVLKLVPKFDNKKE